VQARRSCWRRLGNRHARQHPAACPSEHTPLACPLTGSHSVVHLRSALLPAATRSSSRWLGVSAASPGTPRQHSPAPAQHNGDEHRNELAGWLMQHALTPIAECGQLTGGNRMRAAAVVTGNARAAPPPGRRRMGSGSWRSGLGPHSACCSFVPHSNGRYAARRAKALEDHPHDATVRPVGSRRFCPSHGTYRMAWLATF
jgi:hypothetical protein